MGRDNQRANDRPEERPSIPAEAAAERNEEIELSDEMARAIRETLADASRAAKAGESPRNDWLLRRLSEIVAYHRDASVTDFAVACDVVKALALAEYPQACFRSPIDSLSEDLARFLINDPLGREQLIAVWNVVSHGQ